MCPGDAPTRTFAKTYYSGPGRSLALIVVARCPLPLMATIIELYLFQPYDRAGYCQYTNGIYKLLKLLILLKLTWSY